MKNFNKLIDEKGIEIESAICMLQPYRRTPHAPGIRQPRARFYDRTRLEYFPTEVHITQNEIKKVDKTYKQNTHNQV